MSIFEEKVLELLMKIDEKLDKVLAAGSKVAAPAPKPASTASEPASTASKPATTVKPSEVIEKQKEKEMVEEKPPLEGRRVCSECGSTEFNTVEDKDQVIFQQGGMKIFAKKYLCKKCGKDCT
ncbi:MAG: hypothetical protein EU540_06100 [Promethearchaeota archaeon]|nr:MAG: hypothetical protein EU540_06100 [Candidatus Lokiarchaeota archaeon]